MFWLIVAITVWGIFHSLLASPGIKDLLRRAFGNEFMKFHRLFYNLYAVLSIIPVYYLMVTLPVKNLYQASAPYDYMMRVGQGLSIFFLLIAVFQTDILSFAGLRQVTEGETPGKLVTSGLYGYVRHSVRR